MILLIGGLVLFRISTFQQNSQQLLPEIIVMPISRLELFLSRPFAPRNLMNFLKVAKLSQI
jgi:hypothetical protein